MVAIARVRTTWSGFNGGPGYTNLFFRDFAGEDQGGSDITVAAATAATTRVRAFWNSISNYFPNDVRFQVDSVVDVLEDSTGELIDSLTVPALTAIEGQQAGSYSAAAGAVVTWNTASIRNGRRIRGRTFLVPLAGVSFDNSGGVLPAAIADITAAAAALADTGSTPDLGVWARPSSATATDGRWAVVSGQRVPTKSAVLRSRRD